MTLSHIEEVNGTPRKKQNPPSLRRAGLPLGASRSLLPEFAQRRDLRRHRGKFTLSLGKVDVALRALHRLFSDALGFGRLGFVEILAADRGVGQHRDAARLHFEYAAGDENEFFLAVVGA